MDKKHKNGTRRFWLRLRTRLFHTWLLLSRPMTFGVRGVVYNADDNTVFLIRHTYVPGWQFPGGGVEVGETAVESLRRELMEEGNIELLAEPQLRSLHLNLAASRRDHVALYLVRDFKQTSPKMPDMEIAQSGFFRLDELPEETTPATRRRLAELFGDGVVTPYW